MEEAIAVKPSPPPAAIVQMVTVIGARVTKVVPEATSGLRGCAFAGLPMRCVLLTLILALSGFAQENSGRIAGTITDQTGAVVPDARVSATTATWPGAIEAVTDKLGRYALPLLPIGAYTVAVAKAGFRSAMW